MGRPIVWTNTTTGERVGSIGYEAHLGDETGRVRLKYTTTSYRDGEQRKVGLLGRAHDDATAFRGPAMVVRLPSNGPAGREPLLARRRLRLAPGIPAGLSVAARNPLRPRLAPRLQAEGQAWGSGGIGDYVPKPRWMRMKTYDRKLEEIWQAEGIVDSYLSAFLGKLKQRLGR